MSPAEMKTRLRVYTVVVILLLSVLSMRLAAVQLFANEAYQTKAKNNSIRLVPVKAARGEIYTRDNIILANNKLVYTVSLTYLELNKGDNTDIVAENLPRLLNGAYPEITSDYIRSKVNDQRSRLFEPIVLLRDIPWELVVKLEENRQDLPGVTISIEPLRNYPQGSLAGHVLGYIHSISQEELDKQGESGNKYSANSLIGKTGIEKQYEQYLRGADGAQQVEVDARGRPVPNRELTTLDPQAGNNLYLTIDSRLQKVMEQSMEATLKQLQSSHSKARVGAAVLMNVKTGEILAMYSSPALNPDDFKGNITNERAAYYFPQTSVYDPLQPGAATNRAIQVSYPPGSTFKPVTGMAALEKGVVDPLRDFVNCGGAYWIAPYIKCTGVHGNVNMYSAMAQSCNTYFQEMGRRAGKEEIVRIAREFGLGSKTGIDLPDERIGVLPSPEWKFTKNDEPMQKQHQARLNQLDAKYDSLLAQATSEQEKKELLKKKEREKNEIDAQFKIDYNWMTNWQPFDTFNMSIGQGYNSFSVIQLADYVAAIANGGLLWKPYVLSRVVTPEGRVVFQNEPQLTRQVEVSTNSIAEIRRAMLEVTRGKGTAAYLFANFPESVKVGAKTGSAETGRKGDDPLKETHGVFIAFAPFDNPEIAFAGVVEYGYSGAISAGPVCKAVFEQYFGLVDHLSASQPQADAQTTPDALQSQAAPGTQQKQEADNGSAKPKAENAKVESAGVTATAQEKRPGE